MKRLAPYLAVGLLVVIFGLFALCPSQPDDPEARIRALLERAVAAAERRDLGELLDMVSERFHSRGMDRQSLKGLLFVQLRRGNWRRVFLINPEIDLGDDGQHAEVTTGAILAGGDEVESVEDLESTEVSPYRFELALALEEDDEWRVLRARYERATLKDMVPAF